MHYSIQTRSSKDSNKKIKFFLKLKPNQNNLVVIIDIVTLILLQIKMSN